MPPRSLRERVDAFDAKSLRRIRSRNELYERPLHRCCGLSRRHPVTLRPGGIFETLERFGEHLVPVINRLRQQVRPPRPLDELAPGPDHNPCSRLTLREQPPHSPRCTSVGDE